MRLKPYIGTACPFVQRLAPQAPAAGSPASRSNAGRGQAIRATAPVPGGAALDSDELRARALDQRLGDEQAEAEPAPPSSSASPPLGGAAGRDVGLADPEQDVGREARPVVADLEAHLAGVQRACDGRRGSCGEIDGVVDDVGEPVDDAGVAAADRLRALARERRRRWRCRSARCGATISSTRWLKRDGLEEGRTASCAERGELGRGCRGSARPARAGARGPRRSGPSSRQRVLELLGHERDGGERRAELVGGGGGEAVELGQVLLAGEHQLGRGERLGELARLLGDPPGVDAGEGACRAGSPSRPRSRRGRAARALRPGTRAGAVDEDEERRRADREQAEAERPLRRQGGGGDQHRGRGTASRTGSAARRSGRAAPRAAGCRRRGARSPRCRSSRWLAGKRMREREVERQAESAISRRHQREGQREAEAEMHDRRPRRPGRRSASQRRRTRVSSRSRRRVAAEVGSASASRSSVAARVRPTRPRPRTAAAATGQACRHPGSCVQKGHSLARPWPLLNGLSSIAIRHAGTLTSCSWLRTTARLRDASARRRGSNWGCA